MPATASISCLSLCLSPCLWTQPAAAAAVLHGDVEAFAYHWAGTYLGAAVAGRALALLSPPPKAARAKRD